MPAMPAEPRLLLIDDDDLSRAVLDLHLSAAGYQLTLAESGDEALSLLAATPPPAFDLVLTDLQMPGTCGAALATALRAHLPSGTPVVVMSGSQPAPSSICGYSTFLLKPFTPEQFTAALGTLGPAASTTDSPAAVAPEAPPVLDLLTFNQLASMLSPAQQTEILTLCFTELEKHLTLMQAASARADVPAIERAAHAIKGSFSMIGARELQSLASGLELHCPSAPADQAASFAQIRSAAARLAGMLSTRGIYLASPLPSGASPDSPPDQETP